jgi:L-iditol 2-dehydrogenase
MKQANLEAPGTISFKDVPVPEPSEGQIVVKIHTALTCGTDLKAYKRGHSLIPIPGPFGHEYSGTVAAVGQGVEHFKEGDAVMGVHSAPCYECSYCTKGLYNLCQHIMENKALGAFAEYLLLPSNVVEQNLYHKPDTIGFEEAALLEPLACVVHPYASLNLENIQSALVIGAGPIGLLHLAYLTLHNIDVTVCDISPSRLSAAQAMGAVHVSPPSNLEAMLNDGLIGPGVDLVVECTGQQSVWEQSVNYVRRGGTVILFGGCPGGTSVGFDAGRLHYDELMLCGSFHYTPRDVRTAFEHLKMNSMDLSRLISGEFPLMDIEKAFALLGNGEGIKFAIKP